AQEVFCPDGTGCGITADISLSHVTDNNGAITINTNSGVNPFLYSIDGGLTFVENNNFTDLAPGEYTVMIQGATGFCSYEEIVSLETCAFTTADIEDSETSSVVTANGSIVITPTSGVGPYQYSIDGGQNFVANNEFLDLAVGNYNVIVQDASEICQYEVSVPILVGTDLQVNEYDLLANAIKVYPNPTYNSINVEFELFSEISDDVKIEVYDNLGRTIKTSSLSKNSSGKTTLSLDGFVSGSYFIRCHNGNFSKTFKVVKM
ncbi:MAG: T9SS type A sorting domain-containing protein, partial [Flavobacteriales bacterium]